MPRVAVVTSDDARLAAPAPRDARLDYAAHIRPMVRLAAEAGGLPALLAATRPGADGVLDVVCKVNIVHAEFEPGDVTDWRVVKALFEAIAQWAPEARLTVAEGGVWFPPERTDLIEQSDWQEVGDGFETAGYRAMLRDPDLSGIDMRIVDLNYDDVVQVEPPGGGLVADSYWVPRTVHDAEVFISVPVLKITGQIGMTVAVKNLIGMAPGMKYGWPKSSGWPPGSGNPGLWHTGRTLDETLVDLAGVAGVDFAVVDGIMAMERGRIVRDGGIPKRMNLVVAGNDLFAVDAVSTRIMGMNPADFEFQQLAQRRGLGVADLAHIQVIGDLAGATRRFLKRPHDWDDRAHFGMSNRTWLLKGPVAADSADAAVDPGVAPRPGVDGWSNPVYFYDERIDLDKHFDDPAHCSVYAYAEFVAPRTEPAELWVGSDEGMTVWIDGRQVYQYRGRRNHVLPCDRIPVQLTPGVHRVLVRADQKRGDFDFSLKLVEVEPDERYDGNTVFGLHWQTPEAPPGTPLTEVPVHERPSTQLWWHDAEVDLVPRDRLRLYAHLPERAPGTWADLVAPRIWGPAMELRAVVADDRVQVSTTNLAAFRLDAAGPVARLLPALAVEVDGQPVDLGADGVAADTGLCFSAPAGDGGGWRRVDPGACAGSGPLAWNPTLLSNRGLSLTEGTWDTPAGNWFTDGLRAATGADVVLQNNGGIRFALPAGDVTPESMFRINYPDWIYTFQVTGAQLLAGLEHDLRDDNRRPLQVSGLRYAFDRSRPQGQRIVESSIDPARLYTVAAEDFLCNRADGILGYEVDWTNTGVHVVDALVRYAARSDTLTPPPVGRIREVTP